MINLFLDLDGVMADFDKKIKELGFTPNEEHKPYLELSSKDKEKDREQWKAIWEHGNFFLSLEKMPDADILFEYIEKYDPIVITGVPTFDRKKMKAYSYQKFLWVQKNLGIRDRDRFIACASRDKQKHMKDGVNVLIDDRSLNCKNWWNSGGIPIQHTDANSTIKKLKSLSL